METNDKTYTNVMNKLKFEPSLDATNITISIQGNRDIVILGGSVASYYEKIAAERAVKRLANIRAIANEITVVPSSTYIKTDLEIAKDVTRALKSNLSVPHEKIQSVVKNGIVTLSGEVSWQFQKNNAFNAVHDLFGIRSVNNDIVIKSHLPLESTKVKNQIVEEFQRIARLDARDIEVEVKGTAVILKGEVRNFDERTDAEDAAWAVPGVNNVDNRLTIE